MKRDSENELRNYNAWLMGRYFADAVAACLSKNARYPEKPYGSEERQREHEEESMSFEELMLQRADRFRQFVRMKNKRKGGESNERPEHR